MGAYLGGVLAGGDWNNELQVVEAKEDGRDARERRIEKAQSSKRNEQRAVSAEYFEFVCPPSRRVEIVYGWPEQDLIAGAYCITEITQANLQPYVHILFQLLQLQGHHITHPLLTLSLGGGTGCSRTM